MVESALRSSRRMRRLVGDLLILARADAGRQGARRPCDLAAITEAAAAEVRPVAPEHTINLALEPASVEGQPRRAPPRRAQPDRQRRPPHAPRLDDHRPRLRNGTRDAVLEVADDGPGIPEGLADQVFGRFVRGSGPADVTAESGTGLGLSIVRAVATAHGGIGRTSARSNHGGALFTVDPSVLSESARGRS